MHTMDSRIGLDFIVENPEYTRKLVAALDTNNVAVKKQVFELLSALCVYNDEGYARALNTLDHYKVIFFLFYFFLKNKLNFTYTDIKTQKRNILCL